MTQSTRPVMLTPIVALLVFVDLLGFADVPAILSSETLFYAFLSALMVPIYWALYRGRNWSRFVFIALSFVALISGTLNINTIISQYTIWRLIFFIAEMLSYIVFLSFAFLPSVRTYFLSKTATPHVLGHWQLAPLWRRLLALMIELMTCAFIILPLYYFALKTQIEIAKLLALVPAAVYLVFFPYWKLNLSRFVLGIQVVNLSDSKLWPIFAIFRLVYGILLFPFNCLYLFFDPYSQGFHDHICGTIVLIKK